MGWNKRPLLLFALAALIFGLSACKEQAGASAGAAPLPTGSLAIVTPDGRHDFNVELAMTRETIQRGLMFREHMARDAGMLFLFADEDERGFYMKNTLIPLDMIFIRKSGVIHSIHENAKPLDETTIFSKGPVAAVLELNGGSARSLGIGPGDIVHHAFFGNGLPPGAAQD